MRSYFGSYITRSRAHTQSHSRSMYVSYIHWSRCFGSFGFICLLFFFSTSHFLNVIFSGFIFIFGFSSFCFFFIWLGFLFLQMCTACVRAYVVFIFVCCQNRTLNFFLSSSSCSIVHAFGQWHIHTYKLYSTLHRMKYCTALSMQCDFFFFLVFGFFIFTYLLHYSESFTYSYVYINFSTSASKVTVTFYSIRSRFRSEKKAVCRCFVAIPFLAHVAAAAAAVVVVWFIE